MLQIFNSYIPPLWESIDNLSDDTEPIIEGDLVEFTDHYNTYDGCGIIHYFTRAEFKNPETNEFEMLPCAVIVSANPNTDWHEFVPLQNIDPLSLTDYISLWESEYEQLSEAARLQLRKSVAEKMYRYSRINNSGYGMRNLQSGNSIVQFPINTNGGAQ